MAKHRFVAAFLLAWAICLPVVVRADAVITDIRLIDYDIPRTHAFVTSKASTNSCHGIFVLITATDSTGKSVTGLGDILPRALVTSETIKDAKTGAEQMRKYLLGQHLPEDSIQSDVKQAREWEKQCNAIAASVKLTIAAPPPPDKQLRATLCGVDEAILDVIARLHGVPIYEVLGGMKRPSVTLSAYTSGADEGDDELTSSVDTAVKDKLAAVRVKVGLDAAGDNDRIRTVASELKAAGGTQTKIWVDANQAWKTADVAIQRLSEIKDTLTAAGFTSTFICEQPTAEKDMAALAAVTAQTRKWNAALPFKFTIMADEAVWTLADAKQMVALDAADADNIKIQKAGGLLASMEIAEFFASQSPDTHVYIGGVVSTDVTSWANLQLALALPRLDYITACVPRRQYVTNIASVPIDYATGHVMKNPTIPGLGTDLNWTNLQPYIHYDRNYPRTQPSTQAQSSVAPASQP